MMAGPYVFGTTATLEGIWAIYYRLHVVMQWGTTVYMEWFRAHVLAWAHKRASAEEVGEGVDEW